MAIFLAGRSPSPLGTAATIRGATGTAEVVVEEAVVGAVAEAVAKARAVRTKEGVAVNHPILLLLLLLSALSALPVAPMAIDVGCHTGVRWRGADDSLINSLHGNSFGFPPRTSLPDPSKFVPCLGFPGEGPTEPTTPGDVSRRRGADSYSAGRAGQFRSTSGLSNSIVSRKRVSSGGGRTR